MNYKAILIPSILAIFTSCSATVESDNPAQPSALSSPATNSSSSIVISTISSNTDGSCGPDSLPAAFCSFGKGVTVYKEGNFVVLESKGVPDHKSPYWSKNHELYETYSGDNPQYHQNPNTIQEQNLVFRIPLNPTQASTHAATPLGPIGISINGVSFFNQNAAPGDDLSQEINTFDEYNGHPNNFSLYHYHLEPLYLTQTSGKEAFLGFLLDGFPVYGPNENGKVVNNSDLDTYHGHVGTTKEYPDGIYHYHVTATAPYINGDGFYGTSGTVGL